MKYNIKNQRFVRKNEVRNNNQNAYEIILTWCYFFIFEIINQASIEFFHPRTKKILEKNKSDKKDSSKEKSKEKKDSHKETQKDSSKDSQTPKISRKSPRGSVDFRLTNEKILIQHTVNSLFSTPNQQDLRRRHSVAVVKPNLIENRKHKESKSQDDSQG